MLCHKLCTLSFLHIHKYPSWIALCSKYILLLLLFLFHYQLLKIMLSLVTLFEVKSIESSKCCPSDLSKNMWVNCKALPIEQ